MVKLLLTSGGITNPTLAQALLDLVGKPADQITLAFIPTAVNASPHDKGWFIDNLQQIREQNYKFIDIVDISALPKEIWEERLRAADVIFVSGGVTPHLMYWVQKSGLKELLPELLKTKAYVGVSAGSIIMSPSIILTSPEKLLLYKEKFGYDDTKGLGFVDFYLRPHMNATSGDDSKKEYLEKMAKQIPQVIYGLDDQMAIKVVDGKTEVVGEGEYVVFNS